MGYTLWETFTQLLNISIFSPFFMGKLIISRAVFNGYVKLPEGISGDGVFLGGKNSKSELVSDST